MSEIRIKQDSDLGPREVFGTLDANLKAIEKDCGVEVAVRGDEIIINGEDAERAASVIGEMFTVAGAGQSLDEQKVNYPTRRALYRRTSSVLRTRANR